MGGSTNTATHFIKQHKRLAQGGYYHLLSFTQHTNMEIQNTSLEVLRECKYNKYDI